MNIIEISCPAKTFLIGEYAVLDEAPAILLNTNPRFTCQIKKTNKAQTIDIPKESPADQWMKKNPHDFHCVELKWTHSSHLLNNGLGFSSAMFNVLYAYSFILREGHIDHIKPQEIWRSYRNLHFDGFKPSGADVISQWVGGLSIFEQDPLHVETLTSYFPDLECLILKTEESFNTHEYLKDFKMTDLSDLKRISCSAVNALKEKNQDQFLQDINNYRKKLIEKNFITEKSLKILNHIEKLDFIKAFKACGTMGAETLIVFYDKQKDEEAKSALSFLEIVADSSDLSYGLSFHKKTKEKEREL